MTNLINNLLFDYCGDHRPTKVQQISQEVGISPSIYNMTLQCTMSPCFVYDSTNPKPIKIAVVMQFNYVIRSARFYCYLEDFDSPNGFHICGLSGPLSGDNGIVVWADDTLPVEFIHQVVSVTIKERSLITAMKKYRGFVNQLESNGHRDLFQPPEPPQLPMSPFLRFKLVCLYQRDIPGDLTWHKTESTSEAFMYKPEYPTVVAVQPNEIKLYDPTGVHGDGNVIFDLNRPIINGYDELHGATLLLSDGTELPIDNIKQLEPHRLSLDLRACLTPAIHDERLFAKIRIRGRSGGGVSGRDWTLVAEILIQRGPPPGLSRLPSKRERQLRVFDANAIEEDEPDMFGGE